LSSTRSKLRIVARAWYAPPPGRLRDSSLPRVAEISSHVLIGSCLLTLSRVLGTLPILRRKHLRLRHLARQHRHLHLVRCKILQSLRRHLPTPLRLRSPVRRHHLRRPMTSHPHLARCKIPPSLRRPRHTTWRLLIFPCLAPPECISVSYHVNGMCAALQLPRDIGSLPGAIPLRLLPPKVFGFYD
jgi:hypothetical protein